MRKKLSFIFGTIISLILVPTVFAHEGHSHDVAQAITTPSSFTSTPVIYSNLEEQFSNMSFTAVGIATGILFVLTLISLLLKKPKNTLKAILFISIALTVCITTFYLAALTIYLNSISLSKGPVHWHADTEIWACGKELDIQNPTGLSNKIGTATLHEHNDKRIHLEGVVVDENDASLGKFFHVIGGELSQSSLSLPTTEGQKTYHNGETCDDGTPAEVNVFVYKTIGNNYYQTRPEDPAHYDISPEPQVPPGDCVIVEFGPRKEKTDKLCLSFKVAKEIGKLGEEVAK